MVNGVAIFDEIKGLEAATLSTKTTDGAKARLRRLEASPPACDGEAVTAYLNEMVRDVNPYLPEKKSDAWTPWSSFDCTPPHSVPSTYASSCSSSGR